MADANVCLRVARDCQWDHNLLTGAQCDLLPADAPCDPAIGHWLIAFDKANAGQFAGFACLKVTEHEGYGYLARAGVYENYRGKGLQVRMIRARERLGRQLGLTVMVCDTHRNNIASSNSLIRCGYKLYRPHEPWALAESLYWIRKL